MYSSSFDKFIITQNQAIVLRIKAGQEKRKIDQHAKYILLHSAIAFNVSSWDAYINNIVREFIVKIQDISINKYSNLHHLVSNNADLSLKRFNTPNHENTRTVLLKCTGYDPYPDWIWSRKGWSGLQTREFLNEILKVRHSFAHGFPMPHFEWNTDASGNPFLSCSILKIIEYFFRNLVKKTDRGLKQFMLINYNTNLWA